MTTAATHTPQPARCGGQTALRWLWVVVIASLWTAAVESTYHQHGLLVSVAVGIEFFACVMTYLRRALA